MHAAIPYSTDPLGFSCKETYVTIGTVLRSNWLQLKTHGFLRRTKERDFLERKKRRGKYSAEDWPCSFPGVII